MLVLHSHIWRVGQYEAQKMCCPVEHWAALSTLHSTSVMSSIYRAFQCRWCKVVICVWCYTKAAHILVCSFSVCFASTNAWAKGPLKQKIYIKGGLRNWSSIYTSIGVGLIECARAPPLRELFTWIYLPTINQLLSIRNISTKIHSVYPRLIVWYTRHCQQPFKASERQWFGLG